LPGRKLKLVETTKKHLTKKEKTTRKAKQDLASEGFTKLQTSAPRHLNTAAKAEYRRVIKDIVNLPVRNLDRAALENYCTWYAIYKQAEEQLSKYGPYQLIDITREGKAILDYSKKSPMVSVLSDASSRIYQFASSLGMTVDSRMKIVPPDSGSKKEDPFAKFGGGLNG
jgi:P27 family predicted phage terminase small subunit